MGEWQGELSKICNRGGRLGRQVYRNISGEAPVESCETAVVLGEAAVALGEAPVVSCKAPVVSYETPVVSRSAPFACQLIRETASFATGVSHIASVRLVGARIAIGFARVAYRNAACAIGFVTFAWRVVPCASQFGR